MFPVYYGRSFLDSFCLNALSNIFFNSNDIQYISSRPCLATRAQKDYICYKSERALFIENSNTTCNSSHENISVWMWHMLYLTFKKRNWQSVHMKIWKTSDHLICIKTSTFMSQWNQISNFLKVTCLNSYRNYCTKIKLSRSKCKEDKNTFNSRRISFLKNKYWSIFVTTQLKLKALLHN